MQEKIHNIIIDILKTDRKNKSNFEKTISNFEKKFNKLNSVENRISIKEYFEKGTQSAIKKLFKDQIIENEKDFKGVYVFYVENKPLYVGISKVLISRIRQHVKGKSEGSSTFAYKIAKEIYKSQNNRKCFGTRNQFFKEKGKLIEAIKLFLINQQISFIKIDDDDELALFEIYCSIKLNTSLNTFETH